MNKSNSNSKAVNTNMFTVQLSIFTDDLKINSIYRLLNVLASPSPKWVKWCSIGQQFFSQGTSSGLIYRCIQNLGPMIPKEWNVRKLWLLYWCWFLLHCWAIAAVMWSSFLMFCGSLPANLAIPHFLPCPAAATNMPVGREEKEKGKGIYDACWQIPTRKLNTENGRKSEIAPVATAFLAILGIMFVCLDEEISLKLSANRVSS